MLNTDGTEKDHSFPGTAAIEEKRENGVTLRFTDRRDREFRGDMDVFESGIIRMRLYREQFQKKAYDVVNKDALSPCRITVEDTEEGIHIRTGENTVKIGKNPFAFTVAGPGGNIIYEENMDDVNSVNEGFDRIPPMGFTWDVRGKAEEVSVAPRLHADEHIYGLGEHFTEFDKRGQSLRMRNFDTLGCRDGSAYKNIPFYISSYGYGLYINDPGIFDFEVGSRSCASVSIRVPAEQLEYFIITGENLKKVLSTYMRLTGPAALPPEWSFGLWYSTGFKGNSRANVEQDVADFEKYEIPVSVIHFDCYWLRENMWCDFVWDDDMYPGRKDMLRHLKDKGLKICLWINPYVTEVCDMFKEGAEKGYLVRRADGDVYTADLWHGLLPYCGIVDFTNPEARSWYQEKVKGVLDEGADVMKTDFAEDIPEDAVFFNGLTGKEMRNIYSRLYNQAVYEITCKVKGRENGIVWARSGCAGMQQFPVCWSGDPRSSFEGMAETLRGGLSLAMSGVPFWSHDIGGFYGKVSEEVFVRWAQFGLFSSHSRLHGTTTRQPWAYGKRALEIVRKFVGIRYGLMPYILETAKKCTEEGISFIRPLVLEHPDDPAVCSIWDEYYFGDRMLVCPVFGGDGAKKKLYLPEGRWKDYFSDRVYLGKTWTEMTCALEDMPVFERIE